MKTIDLKLGLIVFLTAIFGTSCGLGKQIKTSEQNIEKGEVSGENPKPDSSERDKRSPNYIDNPDDIQWKSASHFFAAAGFSHRLGSHYSVAVAPSDNVVMVQKTGPIMTSSTLGVVFNPCRMPFGKKKKNEFLESFNNKNIQSNESDPEARNGFAVALLANVFNVSIGEDFDLESQRNLGFGLGYRKSNFLILATLEFTSIRTPRDYFIDRYRDNNLVLIPAGETEPLTTISKDDDQIFHNKIFSSLGIKIAYAFGNAKD